MSMAQAAETAADEILLRTQDEQGVVTLTLNRPKQYNALSSALMTALEAALAAIGADSALRAVVIAGAGKGFCAGHDLKELRGADRHELEQVFAQCSRLMQAIVALPQPVIAKVHGIATAAGCQLVASCDLAVAGDACRFGTPGVNIGLFCSTPMVAISRNVPRKKMMEMLLLGETLSAAEAADHGLINRIAADDGLDGAVKELTDRIVAKSSHTLKIGKEAFYRQAELPLSEAYAYASRVMTENMMARDAGEGIDAFIEKRSPRWQHR